MDADESASGADVLTQCGLGAVVERVAGGAEEHDRVVLQQGARTGQLGHVLGVVDAEPVGGTECD